MLGTLRFFLRDCNQSTESSNRACDALVPLGAVGFWRRFPDILILEPLEFRQKIPLDLPASEEPGPQRPQERRINA